MAEKETKKVRNMRSTDELLAEAKARVAALEDRKFKGDRKELAALKERLPKDIEQRDKWTARVIEKEARIAELEAKPGVVKD
nr:MAG TPA_asm: hypothetical protein [Caudoviricetes sp.]